MLTQAVLNTENKEIKKIDLEKGVFGAPIRRQLLFDAVKSYLLAKRQGTAKAKFRWEVKGSTKKIYKQKGTGNARHGGIRANIFVGGGIAFPPRPRVWNSHLSQTMRQEALRSALSLRKKEGNLLVVDGLVCKEIKTKTVVKQLAKWGIHKGLIVLDKIDDKTWKSLRNIPHIEVAVSNVVNVLDILRHEKLVVTVGALSQLEKRLV